MKTIIISTYILNSCRKFGQFVVREALRKKKMRDKNKQ